MERSTPGTLQKNKSLLSWRLVKGPSWDKVKSIDFLLLKALKIKFIFYLALHSATRVNIILKITRSLNV